MENPSKTNQELIEEISTLKQRIKELEQSGAKHKQAEEALRFSQQQLRLLIDTGPDFFFLKDLNLSYQLINSANARFFGRDEADILGKTDIELMPEEAAAACQESDRLAIREKRIIVTVELVGDRFYETYKFPVLVADEIVGVAGIIRDITERKRMENTLRDAEMRYRLLFEDSPDGILIIDPDRARPLEFNQTAHRQLGYSREEFSNLSISDVEVVETPEETRARIARVVRGERADFETRQRTKQGEIRNVHVTAQTTEILGKSVYHCIWRDITSRKQAEEEILGERSKFKTLSDNAPFGMVLGHKEGRFTYMNRKFTELFGYDLSDIPDIMTWREKAYPDAEYRHTVIAISAEEFKDARPGERRPRVYTVTCKDGTQKIVQLIASVLPSGDYLMTCEDITELRKLESRLLQAQKMEAVGTLAGGIAHDFNNILTALMGYATLIQAEMDTSNPLRPYVDEVLSASEKAADLTQSLLTFSRQQSVTLIPLNMNNTIKVAEKLLKRLLTEDIEPRTSLTDDDTIVMADKSQMDQILFNLATNARDAMPKGGILTITTAIAVIDDTFMKAHGFGEAGKYVQISVSDTGAGMDEITQQKIFDPFFTTKEVGKGTGLGLATVYGIVKQHNGYITVESALNRGTTFHIYLPAIKMKVNETEDTAIPIKRGKETILIAEDNEGVRRFMREALQGYGYTIREATDGEDAVEKFRQYRDIDLIIIDSVMPKKNGRETYEEIHSVDPHIKVLFTSGYTKDIVLDKGIEEKEFAFISKPLSPNKLLQKVREVLDKEEVS
jgi:two-component system cell cycle sensor histidine kinase/response regulator CckA